MDIPLDESAPAVARAALEDVRIDPALMADLSLLVSELVTNSVKYGCGAVHLQVAEHGPHGVRVVVGDEGPGFCCAPRTRESNDIGGWGLHLVQQLSDRWGQDDPNHVWFELYCAADGA